jgi:histidinol-phosphate aminotransferase
VKKRVFNRFFKIKRDKPIDFDRTNYLRLDKNEKVIIFKKNFLNYLKKKINTFNISSYPNIEKTYNLLAKKIGIPRDSILITAGSDLAIRNIFEVFRKKKSKVITIEPTFGMVNVYSKIFNYQNIKIYYNDKLQLNIKKVLRNLKKNISFIIIANPNSPTGTIIEKNDLLKILAQSKSLNVPVVIDEAYTEFYGFSYMQYVKKYNNLIIIRTFSKAFGLAGLRAGFLVANKNIVKIVSKLKPMYEINSLACLSIEFLLKKQQIVKNYVKDIIRAKNFFFNKLKSIQVNYIDTYANFVHVDLKNKKKIIEKELFKRKILVRKGPGVKSYDNYLRISLGSKSHMQRVFKIIKKNLN